LPDLKNLDIVKLILDCWSSEKFKKAVYEIDGKPIDEQQMFEKKNQLLNMTEGVKLQCELRYVILHTPFYVIFAYHVPKSFYVDPMLISAYEIYSDPVSIELRTYGTPYEIDRAMKLKKTEVTEKPC
jgi:hypothetical protein